MGICIPIYKFGEINGQHVYRVCLSSFGKQDFYVVLSAGKNRILFYKDPELKDFLRELNMDNPSERIFVHGIHLEIVFRVLRKCLQAIKNNNFPNDISYEA